MTNVRCLELQLALNSVEGVEVMRALDHGPLTLDAMRHRTGLGVLPLDRVTRTLMTYGLVARRRNGIFARTDVSAREAIA